MRNAEPVRNQPIWLKTGERSAPTRLLRRVKSTLYVQALREGDRHLTPTLGQEVEVRWLDGNNFYAMPGVVEEVLDPIPVILLRITGTGTVLERRGAPRVKLLIPLEYSLARPGAEVYTTTTLDLSWDGLRFPAAFRAWLGLELKMELRVDGEIVAVTGRVVRVAPQAADLRGREAWETAVQFVNLLPSGRLRIRTLVERVLAASAARDVRPARAARVGAGQSL